MAQDAAGLGQLTKFVQMHSLQETTPTRVASLRRATAGDLVLSGVGLDNCAFAGAHGPSLRTRGMAVDQACLSTDLGVRRQGSPIEVNDVAVLNCCTSPRCELSTQPEESESVPDDDRLPELVEFVATSLLNDWNHDFSTRQLTPPELLRSCRLP
jgi:hypothetical protein